MKIRLPKIYYLMFASICVGLLSKFFLIIAYLLSIILIILFFEKRLRQILLFLLCGIFLISNFATVILDKKSYGKKATTYYSITKNFKSYENFDIGDIIIGKKESINQYSINIKPLLTLKIPVVSSIISFRKNLSERLYLKSGEKLTLIQGLILGDKSKISGATKDKFTYLGLNHYLAISGLHIGIIAVVLITLIPKIPLKPKLLIVSIILLFFTILTGFKIPVIRSVIFFAILTITYIMNVKVDFKNFVILIGSIFTLISPPTIFNLSFILSFSAILGIAFIIEEEKHFLFNIFITSIAATIFTLPFVLYFFKMYNFLAVINTIVVFPIIYLHIVCGVFTLLYENIFIRPLIVNENILNQMLDLLIKYESHFFTTNKIPLIIFVVMLLTILISLITRKKILLVIIPILALIPYYTPDKNIYFPNFIRSKAVIDMTSNEIYYQGFYSDYRYKLLPYLLDKNISLKFNRGYFRIYDGENIFIKHNEEIKSLTNICINSTNDNCLFEYFTNKGYFKGITYRQDKIYIVYDTDLEKGNIFTLKNKKELIFSPKGALIDENFPK
ncbi:ComEC/Rec2 family competence protein [Deferribacteraceae bacterium V6Fe1]|nr:ComEC/Rec2 family competence protein [Deferribacteraceae bacterium V6Fe1]